MVWVKNAKQLLISMMNWTHSERGALLWTQASNLSLVHWIRCMQAYVFVKQLNLGPAPDGYANSWCRDRAYQGESIDWLSHCNRRSRVGDFTAQTHKEPGWGHLMPGFFFKALWLSNYTLYQCSMLRHGEWWVLSNLFSRVEKNLATIKKLAALVSVIRKIFTTIIGDM